MQKIFVDTNFLMSILKYKIDIFSELDRLVGGKYTLVVSRGVLREIENLGKGKGKSGAAARLATSLINRKCIVEEHDGDVDAWLCGVTGIVCTNDKELCKKLRANGKRIIVVRGKSKLEFY
ncbi:MAG: hypothetical protein QXP42_03800 [Candidatus Micrarchaeia archaeon]